MRPENWSVTAVKSEHFSTIWGVNTLEYQALIHRLHADRVKKALRGGWELLIATSKSEPDRVILDPDTLSPSPGRQTPSPQPALRTWKSDECSYPGPGRVLRTRGSWFRIQTSNSAVDLNRGVPW